ncbi:MAG: DinB family protein, partial [Candidatus Methylomirabilota bacterium]
LRTRNLGLLKAVGRKAWDRTATHPTFGTVSAAQMVVHLGHHDANHLGQIESIRKTLKNRKPRAGYPAT